MEGVGDERGRSELGGAGAGEMESGGGERRGELRKLGRLDFELDGEGQVGESVMAEDPGTGGGEGFADAGDGFEALGGGDGVQSKRRGRTHERFRLNEV